MKGPYDFAAFKSLPFLTDKFPQLSSIGFPRIHEPSDVVLENKEAHPLGQPLLRLIRFGQMNAGRHSVPLAGGDDPFISLHDLGMIQLSHDTQRKRQVMGAHHDRIDTRNGSQYFDVVQGLLGLQPGHHQRVGIFPFHIFFLSGAPVGEVEALMERPLCPTGA